MSFKKSHQMCTEGGSVMMKVGIILSFLTCYYFTIVKGELTEDTLSTNASNYSSNDPISITLTTENVYSQVHIIINKKQFSIKTDRENGLTGKLVFNGFVTYTMGPESSVSTLVIETKTQLLGDTGLGPTVSMTVLYSYIELQGAVYFSNPPNNPTQLIGGHHFKVTVFSNVAFNEGQVILNGQPFCSFGSITEKNFVSCVGRVPATLPEDAQFSFSGVELNSLNTSIVGPTVQLIPSSDTRDLSATTDSLYYSNPIQFNYAVSSQNFYVAVAGVSNSLGFKPIGTVGNNLTPIAVTPSGASIKQVTAYEYAGIDQLWAIDIKSRLYCGTISRGISLSTSSTFSSLRIMSISVGATGIWVLDFFGRVFNNSSPQCNSGSAWIHANLDPVDFISAGLSGVYFHTSSGIYQLASPTGIPQSVPIDGPTSVASMSASTSDDSLVVVDTAENIWILSGPFGNWYLASFSYLIVACYDFSNFYSYYQDINNVWNVDFITTNES